MQSQKKDVLINMRIQRETRDFIDEAARSAGKVRSAFILDAAREKAQESLMDKTEFRLNDSQWAEFNRVLDNPPQPNEKLLSLLAAKAPWE